MRTRIFYFFIAIVFSGCSIDNYSIPEQVLSGKIIDTKTGELVPSSGANEGTIIKLFEGGSNQPLTFNTYPDGTFKNSRVFPANYKIVPEGGFKTDSDTMNITINSKTEIEIKVIPNVRLDIVSSSVNSGKGGIEIEYAKTDPAQKLLKLGLVWSTYPFPNVTVFPEGNIISNDVSSLSLIEGKEKYEVTPLKSGITYYLRAFALTDNAGAYYNYSEQITLEIK